MFFAFPNGIHEIAIEQQNFKPEFVGDDGREWFRAPNHFAQKILNLNMAFGSLPPGIIPVGCELADDGQFNHGGAEAVAANQERLILSLREETRLANEETVKLTAQLRQVESLQTFSAARIKDLETENGKLKARLDEFEGENETREAMAKGNKK
jgi:hypothetical protein